MSRASDSPAVCDGHCHFFSSTFFRALGRESGAEGDAAERLPATLGWDPPGADDALADRWVAELDRHGVAQAMIIASAAGDEGSVAVAVRRHPSRLVGAFLFNPAPGDVVARLERAFAEPGLRTVCLFPAMHKYSLDDDAVEAVFAAAERHSRVVFVHCGRLSLGVRARLGLPNAFDPHLGDPIPVAGRAERHPSVPVIIPHFGAGAFDEALEAARRARNILIDTSSSNGWMAERPGLTLREVFTRTIDTVGPDRILFGTDSSFFPRGWQRPVADAQQEALADQDPATRAAIFAGTFKRHLDLRKA